MKILFYFLALILGAGLLNSCRNHSAGGEEAAQQGSVVTPVTVTHVSTQPLADYLYFNATSVFQNQSLINANMNGYVEKVLVTVGEKVAKGQLLFVLKTKEAASIGNQTIDSTWRFNGEIRIVAAQPGFITQIDHQQGDYILDGSSLGAISDINSFVFLLSVPFELSRYVTEGKSCRLLLPDGQNIPGNIMSAMPFVDSASQAGQYIVKVDPRWRLPANLVARVAITRSVVPRAVVLPKSALLTNENQTEWWVMKMANDSQAVRIPVKIGIVTDSVAQIISPSFKSSDRILNSGSYGLPDSALVSIQK